MIVVRYWVDAADRPHLERADWRPFPGGVELVGGPGLTIMGAITGPCRWASIHDSAVPADLMLTNLDLYALPLHEGARVVTVDQWEATRMLADLAEVDALAAQAAAEQAAAEQAAARFAAAVQAAVEEQVPAAVAAYLALQEDPG